MTLGLNGQFSDLKGKMSNQSDISRKFENVLPIASIGYAFAQTKNFNFDYSTNVREPSIQQLQPVINNTDPLNISKGNPDLRPQYTHRANANYVQFNPTNFTNLFASVNVNYSTNSIVNAQTIEQNLVRTTQPVNTKGTFNIGTYTNYGMRIQKLKSRFNVGTNITYNRSINLLNNQESYIHQEIVGGNIRYEFNIEEIWDISITANLSHQKTSYDFNEAQNQRFLNETYGVSTNLNFTPRFWFSSNLNYMIYKGLTSDFYQELPMLNASLSALVLKNGKGELKLALVNALNQNTGVTQTANANSLQQETINSLGRYLMLSFTYSLNKLSNPASGKNNMRRMMFGGMN